MYVNPQGIVKIYRDIPWHSDYEHVRMFEDTSERNTFLERNKKFQSDNFTYIRDERALRVPIKADDLYDCNYISFLNMGFGTRLFCAFITDVRYINNETSEIYFELDWYQTWWYDCELQQCFVEREHVGDDTIGLHTVDEGLFFGDYIARAVDSEVYDHWVIQIKYAPSYYVATKRGNYSMTYDEHCKQYTIRTEEYDMISDPSYVAQMIANINDQVDEGNEVVAINVYPKIFKEDYDETEAHLLKVSYHTNFGRPSDFVNAQGTVIEEPYTPQNGKLYVYPYCFLRATNQVDTIRDYRWENFNVFKDGTDHPIFWIRYNYANRIGCEIIPYKYAGMEFDFNESIPLNEFPGIDFHATDTLAPLKSVLSTICTTLGSAAGMTMGSVGGVAGATAGGTVGGKVGSVTAQMVGTMFGGLQDHSQTKLGGSNCNLNLKYDTFGFWFYSMSIKAEYAKIIDEYFTRYGYKINRVKIPDIATRERFNYIKTNGAIVDGKVVDGRIVGHIPDEAEVELARIFDKGTTVWHDNNIGNYSGNAIV